MCLWVWPVVCVSVWAGLHGLIRFRVLCGGFGHFTSVVVLNYLFCKLPLTVN